MTPQEYRTATHEAQAAHIKNTAGLYRAAAYFLCRRQGQRGTEKQVAAWRYTLPTAVVRMAVERGFTW